jgi:hypothetical protein
VVEGGDEDADGVRKGTTSSGMRSASSTVSCSDAGKRLVMLRAPVTFGLHWSARSTTKSGMPKVSNDALE